ncbi:MAG: 4'-phosphopantetheinyl transferase superfamily protein [Flavobacteriales bacterium]|nr:4'-phosphopantetheinyl transferase superfamily protein [Bacteroidota bacterium]MCB9240174.1 4'-phosphopantetheinyl transferase superfamily protein [Flavobacteriales bacterium]
MPIINRFQDGDAEIALWKINESVEDLRSFLLPDEITVDIQHPDRLKQWMACRCAVQELVGSGVQITKDEYGKPHLSNGQWVSISHTESYAAAIIGPKPVGIDIERITNRIERIAHRFIHPAEAQRLAEEASAKLRDQYIIWCAKEAAYKLYGKKAVDFRDDIRIEWLGRTVTVTQLKDYPCPLKGALDDLDNHLVVWLVEG